LIVWSQLEEDKENWLLETDKQEKPLLLLIQLLIKRKTLILVTRKNNFIAFTLLLDKRDQQSQILWKSWKNTMLWNTPSLLQLQLLKLLHYNSWLLIQDVLLENISEIAADIAWLFMMTCQNKPLHTDKCLFCWEDHQEEKLIQETSFICTQDC